ncbi:hypothetical protein Sjap_026383 [Stephania japonica]|uniref:Uncharacterized protein n=1 Tax=Stephania japonica TaxID=461633 RepID=A0AAP0E6X0_9MAGN
MERAEEAKGIEQRTAREIEDAEGGEGEREGGLAEGGEGESEGGIDRGGENTQTDTGQVEMIYVRSAEVDMSDSDDDDDDDDDEEEEDIDSLEDNMQVIEMSIVREQIADELYTHV